MTGSKVKRAPADRSRININEEHEVRYWTETLKCTVEQLRAAVNSVGADEDNVRAYLQKKKRSIH